MSDIEGSWRKVALYRTGRREGKARLPALKRSPPIVVLRITIRSSDTSAAKLWKIGGSVMVAIPAAVLRRLRLDSGAMVEIEVDGERIAITPRPLLRYPLAELLAEQETMSDAGEDRDWLRSKPLGRELI